MKTDTPGVAGLGWGGFTILELLVVVSIIAILIGFAMPSYLSIREVAKQRKAVVTTKHLELAFNEYYNQNQSWPTSDSGTEVRSALLRTLIGEGGGVAYFEIGTNDVNSFKDPWGQAYYEVAFDADFNNTVTGPGGEDIQKSVIVWNIHSYIKRGVPTAITNKSWE